jgi:hypothetical protein
MKTQFLLLLGMVLVSGFARAQTDSTKIQFDALKFDSDSLLFEIKQFRAKNDSLKLLMQKNAPVVDSLKRTLQQYQLPADSLIIEDSKPKKTKKRRKSRSSLSSYLKSKDDVKNDLALLLHFPLSSRLRSMSGNYIFH